MRRPLTLILCAAIAASVVGSLLPNLAKLPLLIAVTVGTLALLISRRGQLSSGFSRTTLAVALRNRRDNHARPGLCRERATRGVPRAC